MLIGYQRVSTADQSHDLQYDALTAAGCEKIFTDTISGATRDRPALSKALEIIRKGDVLVVWKLDRLGRSLRHLLELFGDLHDRGVTFRSLTQGIDTTGPVGRFVFQLLGAVAELERELTRERAMAGLAAARARGRKPGRKNRLSAEQALQVAALLRSNATSIRRVAKVFGVGRMTVVRAAERVERDRLHEKSLAAPPDSRPHPPRRGESDDDARQAG